MKSEVERNVIIQGDCLEVLKGLPDNCVDCCVTSPPYYGLRDYGIEGQLGLEKTPGEYISKMVSVFEQVKMVLKKDGTLWLNIGDSYSGSGRGLDADGSWNPGDGSSKQNTHRNNKNQIRKVNENSLNKKAIEERAIGNAWVKPPTGYKPKDLIGIPWMLAFALRSAGWWLRQDIIWHKPNPMPESVTDRCTKAHEYIFLLSKSAKYYFDADAISEKSTWFEKDSRSANGRTPHKSGKSISPESQYAINGVGYSENGMRNKRSVWTVTTKPYSDAHFATYPEDLISDCIKAGCPENGIVLDPFMGAGTTALVAKKLNRDYIGIELNQKYIDMSNKRLKQELGMFI